MLLCSFIMNQIDWQRYLYTSGTSAVNNEKQPCSSLNAPEIRPDDENTKLEWICHSCQRRTIWRTPYEWFALRQVDCRYCRPNSVSEGVKDGDVCNTRVDVLLDHFQRDCLTDTDTEEAVRLLLIRGYGFPPTSVSDIDGDKDNSSFSVIWCFAHNNPPMMYIYTSSVVIILGISPSEWFHLRASNGTGKHKEILTSIVQACYFSQIRNGAGRISAQKSKLLIAARDYLLFYACTSIIHA